MPEFHVLVQPALVCALGFAAAGTAVSLYRFFMEAPLRFDKPPQTRSQRVFHVFALLFGGPMILARNSYRARRLHSRALPWVAASGAIAAGWCLFSGLFILTVLSRLGFLG